jgi:multidrug efflux pump subunit AcrA (membrane-fusion protein)
LRFMYSFLRPYKLEVISSMLTLGAVASMVGWPLYRLGKNIHRRGRLPDMKRWRVIATCSVAAAIILFVCFVPLPIGRIRGPGIVEALPDAQSKLFVEEPGLLYKLNFMPGQVVHKGDELAEFISPDLQSKIDTARSEADLYGKQAARLDRTLQESRDPAQRNEKTKELAQIKAKQMSAETALDSLLRNHEKLVMKAPRDGVIGLAPSATDVGKFYERQIDPNNPFCTINEPGKLRVVLPLVTPDFNRLKETVEQTSPAARTSIKHLGRSKVNADYQNKPLEDALADLRSQIKGLKIKIDPASGLTPATPVTFKGEQVRLAGVLDKICSESGLGYIVVMDDNSDLNGWILIRPGSDRIFPGGLRPLPDLSVEIRITGRDSQTWKGKLEMLPESEAAIIPLALSSRGGGPVPVKAERTKTGGLLPQTQYYMVYVDVENPDPAIIPGNQAQVKIYCKSETILSYLWRTVNSMFDLNLM